MLNAQPLVMLQKGYDCIIAACELGRGTTLASNRQAIRPRQWSSLRYFLIHTRGFLIFSR